MNASLGFVLTLLAGASVGLSMWPLKWARRWRWENFWLLYGIFALILLPFLLAFVLLPNFAAVYRAVPRAELVRPFLLGTLWGFAQLGAGISFHRLGFAVGAAILSSIGAAVGTLLPLIFLHREQLLEPSGLLLLGGTLALFLGAWLCGLSGYRREQETRRHGSGAGFAQVESAMRQVSYSRKTYFVSLAIAATSGVLASLLNVALAYGGIITAAAVQGGASPGMAPLAIWPVALLGGSIVNVSYPIVLLVTKGTWRNFQGPSTEVLFPLMAALLWMGGIAMYSSGTSHLGVLGISIGFAIYMIVVVLSGQLAGVVTGEWRAMEARTYRVFFAGIVVLVCAVLMMGGARYFSG